MSGVISDGTAATLPPGAEGPQIPGAESVAFWDPAPPGALDGNGKPIVYGYGPLYCDNPWDVVLLAGQKLPGICTIKCEPQLQIDQQKGPKHDGARLTLHGVLPSPIEITVKLWTEAQWSTFVGLIPLWWRKPQKDPKALAALAKANKVTTREAALMQAATFIYHPGLTPFGITQVVVKGVSLPEDGPEPQTKIVRIKCIEYQPPTKKTSPSKVKAPNAQADSRVVTPSSPSETAVGPTGG